MANKIDICNEALDKLGVEPINDFNEESKQARHCKRRYDNLRQKLLRSHWWNFAIKRTRLITKTSVVEDQVAEIGSTTTNLTLTAHGMIIGDLVRFKSVTFTPIEARVITVVDANNVTLDRTFSTTITAGDVFDIHKNLPEFDYSNKFDLPSDNLRVLRLENNQKTLKHHIEGKEIISNVTEIGIQYVSDVEDVDDMDATFKEGLTYLLASEFAYSLIQSAALAQTMYQKYQVELRDIRSIDAQVGSPQDLTADAWNSSRLVGSTFRNGNGEI